jgi:hypothetical protein
MRPSTTSHDGASIEVGIDRAEIARGTAGLDAVECLTGDVNGGVGRHSSRPGRADALKDLKPALTSVAPDTAG